MFFVNKTSFATKNFIIMIVIEVKVTFWWGGTTFIFLLSTNLDSTVMSDF